MNEVEKEKRRAYEARPEVRTRRMEKRKSWLKGTKWSEYKSRSDVIEKRRKSAKKYYNKTKRDFKLKKLICEHYGGCECLLCGDKDIRVLSIDHINNDGHEHRKVVGTGKKFYSWIVKNNYPPGLQVLCWSCQWAKKLNEGILPEDRRDLLRPIPIKVYSLAEYASITA